jgi:hypothetical protein
MIDRFVVGGFYRVHSGRGKDENLNAPGMHFEPLAFETSCSLPDHCQNPMRRRTASTPMASWPVWRSSPRRSNSNVRHHWRSNYHAHSIRRRPAAVAEGLQGHQHRDDARRAGRRACGVGGAAVGDPLVARCMASVPKRCIWKCSPTTMTGSSRSIATSLRCAISRRADAQGSALRHRVRDHHLVARARRSRGRARFQSAARAARSFREVVGGRVPQFAVPTAWWRVAGADPLFHRPRARYDLKPLDGMGGSEIFRVRHDDPNRNVIVETLTHDGARTIMAQRYIPEIADGDKRILIVGGEVVPYCLARIPKAGETRGNLAAGGTWRGARTERARPRNREHAGAGAGGARLVLRRSRRDRRLADRDQRHQPDVHGRNRRADRFRRRRMFMVPRWSVQCAAAA